MDEHEQAPEAHDSYGETPATDYARPEKGSRRTWMVAGGIAVVVLAVGGFFGVKALAGGSSSSSSTAAQAPGDGGPRNGRRGTIGTLQSIDGSTLTVATFNRGGNDSNANGGGGTTTVITNGSTKFYKSVSGSLQDIKVGDRVTAMGAPGGTNALTADRISDTGTTMDAFGGPGGGPGGGGGRRFANGNGPDTQNGGSAPRDANGANRPDPNSFANGTVKSISGSTLTVTAPDGTAKTVNTTASTAVSVLKSVAINDLSTGQAVVVRGTTNSDGTVTATNVAEGLGGIGGRGFRGGPPQGTGSTTQ